jgi:hypothetical protein
VGGVGGRVGQIDFLFNKNIDETFINFLIYAILSMQE